ncbi:MAG: type II secretion system protein GspN [Desulfocapsaceae bacterium]
MLTNNRHQLINMLKRLFIFLLYCLFALVLSGVLLVFLFPRERVSSWAARLVEQHLDGMACSIEDIRYVHPLKLRLYQVRLSHVKSAYQVPIDTLLMTFDLAWPVRQVGVSAVIYGGTLETKVSFNQSFERFDLENLNISEILLDELKPLQQSIDRPLQGRLGFKGRAVIDRNSLEGFRLSGNLSIAYFSTELRRPILSISSVDLDRVTGSLTVGDGVVDLSDGQFTGELIAGDFSGRILLDRPWPRSSLDLAGGLVPQAPLLNQDPQVRAAASELFKRYRTETIPWLVEGTLQLPEFRFGGLDDSVGFQRIN